MQWSLLFYTLENYESELGDPELGPALVQLALATVAQQEVNSNLSHHFHVTKWLELLWQMHLSTL